MADNSPILIGRDNFANPGAQTLLSRADTSISTDPVFTVRTPVGGDGIHGEASGGSTGVQGTSTGSIRGAGVRGLSESGVGVRGLSESSIGVFGTSSSGIGTGGFSATSHGVHGGSGSGVGVRGASSGSTGIGVEGVASTGIGVHGECLNPSGNVGDRRVGGLFDGGVIITNGLKPFTIDHPLDPQNRYLVHTSVESSEMKNVYDGVVQLDEDGEAWVDLPEWFEALNGDFRYQLTAVGGAAPNLHVAGEVSENRFKIAGGEEGMRICWQLTGTRKDPWAAANPFEVEQEKPEEDRGRYLDPSLYGAPEEQRVMVGPIAEAVEEEQRIGELRRLEEEQRREMEELRRRMEVRQEEAPPEST